jgi:hypothetical protein
MKIKSRALVAYIEMHTQQQATPAVDGFVFSRVVDDTEAANSVSGKSVWQWEREFNDSPFAVYNQRLRTLGDEQRELIKLSKKEPNHG